MENDTLDKALSVVGFGKFQGLAMVFAGLGWISDSMEMMLLSFIGPALQSEWSLSPKEESFLSTVVFLGMLFGANFWGFISDAHGRRMGFICADIVIVATGIVSAFSPNYKLLLVSRCFLGVGIGGAPVFTTWFLEFIPNSHRGSWMVAVYSFWTAGAILEASLAWIIMPRLGWRWLLGLTATPAVIVLLISGFVPESPRFLCSKGRIIEARRLLEKMAQLNQTTVPDGILHPGLTTTVLIEENGPPGENHPSSSEKTKSHTEAYLRSFCELFSSKLLRTTLLLWYLYFAYAFSYYGIVLITSQLSSGQNQCGSVTIHTAHTNLYLDTFITSLAEVPGLILAACIVDKLGRKVTLMITTMSTFIMMLPLMCHQNGTVTTILLFLARIFISGGFSIATVYSKEVYPTGARSKGDGLANSMGRIGGMVCPLVAVGLVRGCHQTAAVGLFEAVLVITGLSILLFPYETKGSRLVDTGEV